MSDKIVERAHHRLNELGRLSSTIAERPCHKCAWYRKEWTGDFMHTPAECVHPGINNWKVDVTRRRTGRVLG